MGEQLIMAVSPSSKNVLIAGAHKKAAVVAEDKADKEFQKAKRVMKSAIKLQLKMKETKVKAVEKLVATKAAAKKAEAKHKAAGRLYKGQERRRRTPKMSRRRRRPPRPACISNSRTRRPSASTKPGRLLSPLPRSLSSRSATRPKSRCVR